MLFNFHNISKRLSLCSIITCELFLVSQVHLHSFYLSLTVELYTVNLLMRVNIVQYMLYCIRCNVLLPVYIVITVIIGPHTVDVYILSSIVTVNGVLLFSWTIETCIYASSMSGIMMVFITSAFLAHCLLSPVFCVMLAALLGLRIGLVLPSVEQF